VSVCVNRIGTGFSTESRRHLTRATGALLQALKEVKQTRVVYLELAEYEVALWSRDTYNDAVVNIFTRLNTAGRTLTREDITFAWLKIGWDATATENRSAKACMDDLRERLADLSISIGDEDVISAISLVWAVAFNSGRLLTNNDLIRGEAIRPMASDISKNWSLLVEAVVRVCDHVRDHGLVFREHYQSVNSLAYLWAWYFAALRWRQEQRLKEREKNSLEKGLLATLESSVDRWLICSQWADVWAYASAQNVAGYAARLAQEIQALAGAPKVSDLVSGLKTYLEKELKELEPAAINGLLTISAYSRQMVRNYYTALWLWNRLD